MNVLLDTNILARMAQVGHHHHQMAIDATDIIHKRGDTPCIAPQVLYEYWVVVTRPVTQNGLGFTAIQAASDVSRLRALFPLLLDPPSVFSEWERIVTAHSVVGKNAHDARLVAAMIVHGVTCILTFNTADFTRFPGIIVLDTAAVVASATP